MQTILFEPQELAAALFGWNDVRVLLALCCKQVFRLILTAEITHEIEQAIVLFDRNADKKQFANVLTDFKRLLETTNPEWIQLEHIVSANKEFALLDASVSELSRIEQHLLDAVIQSDATWLITERESAFFCLKKLAPNTQPISARKLLMDLARSVNG